jgi:hypothetical protein
MSQRFAIPKKVVHASVTMPDRKERKVELFLGDCAASHAGGERVIDLLTSEARFIPVRDVESGQVILLQRSAMMVLSVPLEHEIRADREDGGLLETEIAQKFLIQVVLSDGSTRKGELNYIMPEGMRRLQDFLNLPEPYMSLRDGETAHIISKTHITEVHSLPAEKEAT